MSNLPNSLNLKRRFAAFIMLVERLTLALWQAVTWTLLFCGLWMFQAPLMLGQIISVLAALIYFAGLGWFLYRGWRFLGTPDSKGIDRRIETESAAPHRPLSSLNDRLANPEKPRTKLLWDERQGQILNLLPRLKFIRAQAFMARTDPYALRFAVLLFFLAGLLVAGRGWDSRIRYGLTPFSFNDQAAMQRNVSLWITPPTYTQREQIVLNGTSSNQQDILALPAGSMLKLRVSGGIGKPVLYLAGLKHDMMYSGQDSYMLELEIPATAPDETVELSVKQAFTTRAAWQYKRIPDTPPTIALKDDAPDLLPEGALRFPMVLHDDYGVKTLTMHMALEEDIIGPAIGAPVEESRSMLSPPGTDFETAPLYDLSAHPWAGLPVVFTFTASDHAGHKVESATLHTTLPERNFRHPVASALIALRKELLWSPESDYTDIASKLEEIMIRPRLYEHDQLVFLALRSASSRLFYAQAPSLETSGAVSALLWDIALRIEDGNLTLAARDLRDAQNALEQALRNPDTSDEDIAKLMNDLRRAMSTYFLELQKEMQKRMAEGQELMVLQPDMLSQMIDPDALAGYLDQLQSEMMSGNRSKVQEMLSRLQRLTDMMNPSMAAPLPPDMQMMAEGANELQELIENQEKLLDKTRQQILLWETLRDTGQSDDEIAQIPSLNTQDRKIEQEALRYILGRLMLEAGAVLPEIPETMGKAEREMKSAATLLGENQAQISITHQELAVKYLKDAQQSLQQQLAQRIQRMTGMSFGGAQRYDPLGRPYGEDGAGQPFPGEKVKIPDASERKRAQEILRELRRRAGQLERPEEERAYYRRLLKLF